MPAQFGTLGDRGTGNQRYKKGNGSDQGPFAWSVRKKDSLGWSCASSTDSLRGATGNTPYQPVSERKNKMHWHQDFGHLCFSFHGFTTSGLKSDRVNCVTCLLLMGEQKLLESPCACNRQVTKGFCAIRQFPGPPGHRSSRPGTRTKMFMFLGFRTQHRNVWPLAARSGDPPPTGQSPEKNLCVYVPFPFLIYWSALAFLHDHTPSPRKRNGKQITEKKKKNNSILYSSFELTIPCSLYFSLFLLVFLLFLIPFCLFGEKCEGLGK